MASITKIVILDDYQNVALPYFRKLPETQFEVTVFQDTLLPYNQPSTPSEVKAQLVDRLEPFQIICTMRERTPFPRELLTQLPNLKLLLTTGLRNAALDLDAAKELGIRIVGVAGKGHSSKMARRADSTTQHTVALILGIARNLASDDVAVKTGGWQTALNIGLAGKVFGTAGLGRLGVNVAKIMYQSFGMKVIAWSTNLTQAASDEAAKGAGLPIEDEDGEKTFLVVSKEDLFRTADVLSIHLVLSARSRGIVSAPDLALMKPTALFINTSRGPLVDEFSLLEVLKAGKIKGAALDVFDLEPLAQDSEWRSQEWGRGGRSRVLLTPHMGYVEEESLTEWYAEQVECVQRWAKGEEPGFVMA